VTTIGIKLFPDILVAIFVVIVAWLVANFLVEVLLIFITKRLRGDLAHAQSEGDDRREHGALRHRTGDAELRERHVDCHSQADPPERPGHRAVSGEQRP
jgi:hypothetical protein